MVGLPARGKSYICKKLSKYLIWCGFNSKIFNVGNKRRKEAKDKDMALKPPSEGASSSGNTHDSSFFDSSNAEAAALREKLVSPYTVHDSSSLVF